MAKIETCPSKLLDIKLIAIINKPNRIRNHITDFPFDPIYSAYNIFSYQKKNSCQVFFRFLILVEERSKTNLRKNRSCSTNLQNEPKREILQREARMTEELLFF